MITKAMMVEANSEMLQGYMDGLNPNEPEPSDDRSRSYKHGFANGRDDRAQNPTASYATLIMQAPPPRRMIKMSKPITTPLYWRVLCFLRLHTWYEPLRYPEGNVRRCCWCSKEQWLDFSNKSWGEKHG